MGFLAEDFWALPIENDWMCRKQLPPNYGSLESLRPTTLTIKPLLGGKNHPGNTQNLHE